jgi:transposase
MRGIALRSDFDAGDLRKAARQSGNAAQTRRLLALAAIYEGASRSEAAKIGGVTLQIVRDWVVRFNAEGPDGLINKTAPGRASILNAAQREALAGVVESGPIPAIHGVVRWRIVDLCQWAHLEFGVSLSEQTMSRELHAMNYRKLTARPRHHAQAEGAIEEFKKTSPRAWRRSPRSKASRPAT